MNLGQFSASYKYKANLFEKILETTKSLLDHPIAAPYKTYLDSRVSKKSQDKFEFGFFPNDENLTLLTDSLPLDVLIKSKLIYPNNVKNISNINDASNVKQDRLAIDGADSLYVNNLLQTSFLANHNIISPYRDMYGNIVGFVGRTILSDEERTKKKIDKYKYTPFTKSFHLYGLYQSKLNIIKNNAVVLVEGQIDAATCNEFGGDNVVSLGGTSFTKYQFNMLSRLTNRFYLLLDNDLEGRKAKNKIIRKWEDKAEFIPVAFPDNNYKDIDSYLKSTKTSLQEILNA